MPRIGVRDLKNQAPEILRNVRENQAEYVVTLRGEPIALLLPIEHKWLQEESQRAKAVTAPSQALLLELEELRKEIDESWTSEKSAAEIVAEQRR